MIEHSLRIFALFCPQFEGKVNFKISDDNFNFYIYFHVFKLYMIPVLDIIPRGIILVMPFHNVLFY